MTAHNLTMGIVTPSYNQGAFIQKTIDSVLSQNIEGLTYWVVDGASTDNTLEVLSHIASDQLHIISEVDNGQGHAVNKGIQLLTTDIIGWLNADDIYLPQALHTVLTYFEQHPTCEVLFANAYHVDENNQRINSYRTGKWTLSCLQKRCVISQPTVFFRKSLWQRIGKINEHLHYCMDYEYWIRLAKADAKICFLPDFLAATRIHAQTKTATAGVASRLEAMNMLSMQFAKIHPRWYFAYANCKVSERNFFSIMNVALQEAMKRDGVIKGTLRLFFHGSISVLIETITVKLHAIRDSYKRYNHAL